MARFHLRLSDEEFGALTPRQFHLLLARHREKTDQEHYLAALIASTVANFSLGAPKKPLRPSDFMPTRSVVKSAKKREPSRRLIARNIRCFLTARLDSAA